MVGVRSTSVSMRTESLGDREITWIITRDREPTRPEGSDGISDLDHRSQPAPDLERDKVSKFHGPVSGNGHPFGIFENSIGSRPGRADMENHRNHPVDAEETLGMGAGGFFSTGASL